ncbi:MAG: sigma-70 family RNA polymerase sigma factor [Planctomycetota bacterium]
MTADPTTHANLPGQLGWVRRLALSLARDPEAAADLTQDVAREWVERRPAWAEHGTGLRRWLVRATRSRAVDHARAERARRSRELAVQMQMQMPLARGAPTADEPPHAVLERLERQRLVAAAVHALPEPYRTTILHRYLDEMPTALVAQRLGVPETTVRKRIERGLELLRARLDREFGTGLRIWALALLDPLSRQSFEARMAGGLVTTAVQGVALMGGKKIVLLAAPLVVASMVWWWMAANGSTADIEVGGRGVVVPESVALAREPVLQPRRVDVSTTSTAPAATSRAAAAPWIRGFVFTDEEHRAPSDLVIAVDRAHSLEDTPVPQFAVAAGTWSLELGSPELGQEEALRLWVTSASTVPAQIPVPKQLLRDGGVFDLHLLSGRSLTLLFLDEVTRTPLAELEFELSKAIETQRGGGRVTTRSAQVLCRTDQEGKAVVRGVPEAGAVSVTTDLEQRERSMVIRNGPAAGAGAIALPGLARTWEGPRADRRAGARRVRACGRACADRVRTRESHDGACALLERADRGRARTAGVQCGGTGSFPRCRLRWQGRHGGGDGIRRRTAPARAA